jgi:hypothetical protein
MATSRAFEAWPSGFLTTSFNGLGPARSLSSNVSVIFLSLPPAAILAS